MGKKETGSYIDVNGIRTHYVQAGSGHPLVLIHGSSHGACAMVNYGPSIDRFATAGFTVYAYDQPGYGFSDNPVDHSTEFRVAHAKALLTTLGHEKYHVVGNSAGVYIGIRLALEDSRISRLVLTAGGSLALDDSPEVQETSRRHGQDLANFIPSLENMRKLSTGTLYNQALLTDDLVQLRHEMSIGKNYLAQQKRKETPAPKPVRDDLSNLTVKTLIIWGKNDHGNPVARAYKAFEAIPDAELHTFDKCAHWPMWDQADRFCGVVTDFLNAQR